MPKPFSLQAVLDLMQNRSDEATQRLARLIATERDAQGKLDMLEQYRDDYSERFRRAVQEGLRQPEWRNYQEFLCRLDQAISEQLQAVRRQQAHTAAGQAAWQQQRTRLQAFDALFERHRASEAKLEGRQEQKEQDEFAARRKYDRQDDH
ncbi:MAG: flagellar export protein FliJ [Candidatus Accumulibacter sp.]|uniref:flagellar export protein FliJ n=2 Tax=Candidatus Accumulibacter TaxID=327159 RepID=UPI0004B65192|nr:MULTISPECIES: flagellar export protein FliJ [unclassified Candidatus Accumulibacter]MQM34986.1 flagellar export protein FliJ [Candidatus Accumulibacter phosphatis]MBL8368852.1 flagellar export protein FliJ [Accumulibacter sp.]MBN8512903.1 flagellar export protein FliJ [Accumulibacter sp.]MBO3702138.1 flagellar export protein FliJ [Accumulibacter sp.]HRE69949.1 flagellar export protein FliJ [Accumulibacter sp.]